MGSAASIAFYGGSLLAIIILSPAALLLSLLPAAWRYDNRLYYYLTYLAARISVIMSGIELRYYGIEQIPQITSPSIIMINHTSALDIPLVETLFHAQPHIWISKNYQHIPILGMLLKRMNVTIADSDMQKPIQALRQAIRLVAGHQRHLFLFPEGTRHTDGTIHEFLPGFTLLADKLDRPIIPIVIYGLHKIFPKGSWLIKPSASPVLVSIGSAQKKTPHQDRQEFLANVQNWFTLEMNRLQKLAEMGG